jgi:hypothetical protein
MVDGRWSLAVARFATGRPERRCGMVDGRWSLAVARFATGRPERRCGMVDGRWSLAVGGRRNSRAMPRWARSEARWRVFASRGPQKSEERPGHGRGGLGDREVRWVSTDGRDRPARVRGDGPARETSAFASGQLRPASISKPLLRPDTAPRLGEKSRIAVGMVG